MSDQEITCAECGSAFLFREAEQQFYAERGLAAPPKRCKPCRQARKAQAEGSGGGRDSRGGPRGGDRGAPRFGGSSDRGAGTGNGGPNGRPPFRAGGFGNGAPPRGGFNAPPRAGFAGGAARSSGYGNGPSSRPAGSGGEGNNFGGGAPRGDRGGFNRGGDRPRPAPAPRESWGTRPTDGGNRPPRAPRNPDAARASSPEAPAAPRERAPRARAERPKFDITCAECGTQSQVPFKPLEGRQVFCQPCYKARKGTGTPSATAAETSENSEADSGIIE